MSTHNLIERAIYTRTDYMPRQVLIKPKFNLIRNCMTVPWKPVLMKTQELTIKQEVKETKMGLIPLLVRNLKAHLRILHIKLNKARFLITLFFNKDSFLRNQ
jgi:hypothetical protein